MHVVTHTDSLGMPQYIWQHYLALAQQPIAQHRIPLYLEQNSALHTIGSISTDDLACINQSYPNIRRDHAGLTITGDYEHASDALLSIANALYQQGRIKQWRNEWLPVSALPSSHASHDFMPPMARIERGAARRLGLLTHAVHLTGYTSTGHIWLQRRAANKATDPGMLDTLAGGLVSEGDDLLNGVLRETYEEAGLKPDQLDSLQSHGCILVHRPVPEGVMVELAWSYSALLSEHCRPNNLDGEVSEFCYHSKMQVQEHIRLHALTLEAVLALGLSWQAIPQSAL